MKWLFRRSKEWRRTFSESAELTGERIIVRPEPANYRGGTKPHSAVKGNGHLALTNRRLVFCKLTGAVEEVLVAGIVGTRRSTWFRGARAGRREHLVIDIIDLGEIGFFVRDIAAWERAIAEARAPRSGSGQVPALE